MNGDPIEALHKRLGMVAGEDFPTAIAQMRADYFSDRAATVQEAYERTIRKYEVIRRHKPRGPYIFWRFRFFIDPRPARRGHPLWRGIRRVLELIPEKETTRG